MILWGQNISAGTISESKMLYSNVKFPSVYCPRIRINNVIECVNREIKCCTRVIVMVSDGESGLMLVCARLRYIASNDGCKKRYLNIKQLTDMPDEELYCEAKTS